MVKNLWKDRRDYISWDNEVSDVSTNPKWQCLILYCNLYNKNNDN